MSKTIFQLSLFLFSSLIIAVPNYRNIWEIHEHSYVALPNRSDEQNRKPNQTTLPILNEKEKACTAFDMLAQTEELEHILSSEKIIDESSWEDFNFYFGSKNYPTKHILNLIDRTRTKLGHAYLANQLTQLTSSIQELQRRQSIFKLFLNNTELAQQVDDNLEQFSKMESDLELFFNPTYHDKLNVEISRLYLRMFGMVREDILDKINSNKYLLTSGYIATNLVQPIFTAYQLANVTSDFLKHESLNKVGNSLSVALKSSFIGIPKLLIATWNLNIKNYLNNEIKEQRELLHSLGVPATLMFFNVLSLYSLRQNYKDFKLLKLYLNSVVDTLNKSKDLYEIISTNKFLMENLKSVQNAKETLDDLEVKYILSLKNKTIYNPVEYIYAYKILNSTKDKLLPLAQLTAEVDMYRSISVLLQKNTSNKNKFCIPKYIESSLPYVDFENLWNPILNSHKAVANNIKLGSAVNNQKGYSITLTGPNESGKSNFQKSIIISILMSQSLAISASENLILNPFQEIKYYRNTGDNIIEGKSLYRVQAEQFSKLFTIDSNKITYLALDEPTTGANAEICATVVLCSAKTLKNKLPCVCVLSTHYPLITNLEQLTDGFFKNYKFSIIKDLDGNIIYPYTLQEGISDQHIELDILKREGLDEEILRQVEKLLKK